MALESVPQEFLALIAVLGASLWIGYFLHELGHWFVGWLGHSNPRMHFWYVFPVRVSHKRIETLDPAIIRTSGFVNLLWIPAGLVAISQWIIDPTLLNAFVALVPLVIILGSTDSDAIAFRDPERYRELEIRDEVPGNSLFLPI